MAQKNLPKNTLLTMNNITVGIIIMPLRNLQIVKSSQSIRIYASLIRHHMTTKPGKVREFKNKLIIQTHTYILIHALKRCS